MKITIRRSTRMFDLLLLVILALSGCAPVQRYHPAPISPAETAAGLESRSLLNPRLKQFIAQNTGREAAPWPPESWNLNLLTLAAIYFSPALEKARAEVSVQKAAVVTAGARPNPTLSLQPGVPSPYLFSLSFLIPVQTAGKRRIRMEQAEDLTREARLSFLEDVWKVHSNVRAALLSYLLAGRRLGLLRLEARLQGERLALLQQRFAAGEIARPEVETARLSMLNTRVSMEDGEGRIPEARAALAAAVGVPVAALKGIRLSWPGFERPPRAESFSPQIIQRDAVLDRLDVRKALIVYAASEAELELEIAKQHPDFRLGPGYQFEERHNYFSLGYSVTIPLFNRNQGPIAEAEARRRAAAAAFLATQAHAIAAVEEALTRYQASMRVLKETEKAIEQLNHVLVPKEKRKLAFGEADRLALNAVLLQRPVLAKAWLDALGQAQSALGAIEDAVERPLESCDLPLRPWQAPVMQGSN